ncbi:MAG: 1-acyl-sn-glycerol-3-phosphate acyltransferase [Anaerolineales bacterium]
MENLEKKINTLANDLVDELNKSLGFQQDGLVRPLLKPLVWKPMVRFSELATKFDYRVVNEGFQKASAWFITHFVDRVKTLGIENIPPTGPLVIASNHPGAYDSLVITANIPRDDIKIIASEIPFIRKLPVTRDYMIFTDRDAYTGMSVARKAIQHLKDGGALLVFARGTMDPDPAFMPGSEEELSRWTSSLGLFMRKVPRAKLSVSLISGVLSPKYIKHPATVFRQGRVNKQRLSEFFQVMYQLLAPGKLMVSPNLSIGPALTLEELGDYQDIKSITLEVIKRARKQFKFHSSQFFTPKQTQSN